MKKYEIMFIVRPDIEEADIKKTAEDMVKVLEKDGAKNVTLKDMRENSGEKIENAPRAQMLFKVQVETPLKPKDMLIKEK